MPDTNEEAATTMIEVKRAVISANRATIRIGAQRQHRNMIIGQKNKPAYVISTTVLERARGNANRGVDIQMSMYVVARTPERHLCGPPATITRKQKTRDRSLPHAYGTGP